MAPLAAKSSIKQEDSESPPIPAQSVLDWVWPNEERDNPGKLDRFGCPLASFHELRTREANKEPGNWTVNHAMHVAQWEFYQAGYTGAFKWWDRSYDNRDLFDIIYMLKFCCKEYGVGEPTRFAGISKSIIAGLERDVSFAVEIRRNGGFCTDGAVKTHWSEGFPGKPLFLAARFLSPTGDLSESLKQNLLKLDLYDQLDIKPPPGNPDATCIMPAALATCATRTEHASLSKQTNLENSSVQQDHNGAEENRIEKVTAHTLEKKRKHDDSMVEERVEAALEKQRKLNDSIIENRVEAAFEKQRKLNDSIIENRVEAIVEKKVASYEALLMEQTGIIYQLCLLIGRVVDSPADEAEHPKQGQAELDAAAAEAAVPLQGEVEAGESHQTK